MNELLLRKLLQCRERIEKVRKALPARAEAVLEDERTEAFIAFNLFLLVQDALDLATHLISERGLGIPASHREAFEILARSGSITPDAARAMALLSSLRNRIAHAYGDLDPVRMVREAPVGLAAASRFLDELAASADATPAG